MLSNIQNPQSETGRLVKQKADAILMRIGPLEMQRRHAEEQLKLLWDELDTLGKQHEFAAGIEGAVTAKAAIEVKKAVEGARRTGIAEVPVQTMAAPEATQTPAKKPTKGKKKTAKKTKSKKKPAVQASGASRGRGRPRKTADIEAGNVIPPRTVVAPSKSNGAAPASFAN